MNLVGKEFLSLESGALNVENTKVSSSNFIFIRNDFGSSWDGDIVIKDCVFSPLIIFEEVEIIRAINDGKWDFGYLCCMPKIVTFDGFIVHDENCICDFVLYLFSDFNDSHTGLEPFPYKTTQELHVSDFYSTVNYRITNNNYLLNNIKVYQD